jgi:hypothetical protein
MPVRPQPDAGDGHHPESDPPNRPVSRRCAKLAIDGRITVLNGPEDLYIQ